MDYQEKARKPEEGSVVGEPAAAVYATEHVVHVPVDAHGRDVFIRDFVYRNYSEEEARALEKRNFLRGEPFPAEIVETEDDWERIEYEAEMSGVATDEEVKRVFDRWNSL